MAVRRRDPIKTRRAVLDAAARAVLAHGAGVSLDAVAREAGLSKGGLMHHFRSRDELFAALAEDQIDRFRETVYARVDAADHAPGRLVRAYVRATLDDPESPESVSEQVAVLAAVSTTPGVMERGEQDKRRWDEEFAADGLDRQRVLLIVRAADGASLATLFEGRHDAADLATIRETLLTLSRETGPVVALSDAEGR